MPARLRSYSREPLGSSASPRDRSSSSAAPKRRAAPAADQALPAQRQGTRVVPLCVRHPPQFGGHLRDARVVIPDMIAEGDKVAVRYTIEGTHEGDLFGVPPTGQRVSIESFTVERVSDGKIREHWRVTDTLDMMQQLGTIPTPEHV
jgi:SnoaL-like polyketide cyclase